MNALGWHVTACTLVASLLLMPGCGPRSGMARVSPALRQAITGKNATFLTALEAGRNVGPEDQLWLIEKLADGDSRIRG